MSHQVRLATTPQSWIKNIHDEERGSVSEGLNHLRDGVSDLFEQEFRVHKGKGDPFWVKLKARALRDETGKLLRIIGCINDISMRKSAEDTLIHYSFHDPLTDLPNRIAFIDHLGRRLRNDKVGKRERFALFHINVDGFKEINQAFGYSGGDELLSLVRNRLVEKMSKKAFIARLGADHFMVMQDLRDSAHVGRIIKKINDAFSCEFTVQKQEVIITVTIGACRSDQKYTFPEEMLLEAEKAMYMAKEESVDNFFVV